MIKKKYDGLSVESVVPRVVNRAIIFEDILTVLERESKSLTNLVKNIPNTAPILVEKILSTPGRVVFSGMGKSGHICRKLAATFSSMGRPALFLHPSEALHGDLGMVDSNDFFIALSKSGTGKELEQVVQGLGSQGNSTALICCRPGELASNVDLVVTLPFEREACEMNLAPTSSSTLMIAFGDAVAVAVSKAIGFEQKDFARTHPAGALGKKLLCTVDSFMYKKNELPFVDSDTSFQDVLVTTTSKKLGLAIVVDSSNKLLGVITDGDLRRACELGPELFKKCAKDIMTSNPKTIAVGEKAYTALQVMEEFNITSLVVHDVNSVVGVVHIHDLVKAGIKT